MSLRERRLVRRLKEREERAFRELISEYGERVFNMTYRMMGRRADAEDVAQEVFITVFKSIDTFRGESKFSTWLYRITANHCKNRLKYLARRYDSQKSEFDETVERSQALGSSAPQATMRPDEQLARRQSGVQLQEAISTLDEEHRLLVILRDVEELSYQEICAITDLAEGTVKSRLHRARLALRKKIKKHEGSSDDE